MAKNDLGSKSTPVKAIPTKDKVKLACGGGVKKMAAGGAAKTRKGFPMTKGK